jgi:universal stress protein E
MMSTILVVIDPDESEHGGLSRIKSMPVDVADFYVELYVERSSTPPREKLMASSVGDEAAPQAADYKLIWLDSLVQSLRDLGYTIETRVIVFDRLYETIIRRAAVLHADLIFKPLRQHGFLRRALFSATDWNLVRCCPAPLLLINHASAIHRKPVIAAVDVDTKDVVHQELNQIVLSQARQLADLLGSTVHLVNAYSLSPYIGAGSAADQVIRLKQKNQLKSALNMAAKYQIAADQVHLREGAADIVINDLAREIDAGVIVLGTVARSGISGLFIGNTAESIMEHTQSDVVAVKQSDFISSICPC